MKMRSSAPQVKVGIIGTGWVATERHIPSFQRDRRAETVAILDRNREKVDSVARQFGISASFDDIDKFLEQPMDVVAVCTPPQAHALVVEAAVKAGKHVLVEKPMTLTSEAGRFLETLSEESGLMVCPSHNFKFSRSARKADELILSGQAGEVQSTMGVQLSSWRRRLPTWFKDLPGGLFFDEAPHLLYLMQHFMGELSVEKAWQTGEAGDEFHKVEARLQSPRGDSYLTMWFGAPFSEWLLIIFCSRAVLVLDLFRDVLVHLPPEEGHNATDVLKTSLRGTLQFWNGIGASGLQSFRKQFLFGHDLLIKQFLDAVIDRENPPVSTREGWEVIALIEKMMGQSSSLPCLL